VTFLIVQTVQKLCRLFFVAAPTAPIGDAQVLKLTPIAPGAISIVDPAPVLAVPVRTDGSGKVLFGSHVYLGFLAAPKMGNGEILIQARTPEAVISIGEKTVINNNVSIVANLEIRIGERCLIGNGVLIIDNDFHHVDPNRRHDGAPPCKAIVIGDNVWIGASAIILKGTQIGENSVVGAGAVVSRDVPPNVVAAGNPAAIIRQL
jgi:acetyltransferase-like isoleucine patch superfamily enzyme